MSQKTKELPSLTEFEPILVAVSGGADSMALLCKLHEEGVRIIAASFDHQIRPDSASDVEFVQAFCARMNIPFYSGSGNVPARAAEFHLSLEESARQMRYDFLYHTAADLGCRAIVTGHTMDDQAETIVMHFLRGAGLTGLKGIQPVAVLSQYSNEIKLIRPLLSWRRDETEEYCRLKGIIPREDSTNADQSYPRNRIRTELIPILKEYNPAIVETISRNASVLREQYHIFSEIVDDNYAKALVNQNQRFTIFSIDQLTLMPQIIVKEIMRKAIFSLRPGIRDIDASALEWFNLKRNTNFGGGGVSFIENNLLYIAFNEADLPIDAYPQLEHPINLVSGPYALSNEWSITIDLIDGPINFELMNKNARNEVWVGINSNDCVTLRPYQIGDRFVPFGFSKGSVKCSDLFINYKIPKRYRSNYPILEINRQIVWIPLLRRSDKFNVQNNTPLLARIKVQRLEVNL